MTLEIDSGLALYLDLISLDWLPVVRGGRHGFILSCVCVCVCVCVCAACQTSEKARDYMCTCSNCIFTNNKLYFHSNQQDFWSYQVQLKSKSVSKLYA